MKLVLGHGIWSDERVFTAMLPHLKDPAEIVLLNFPGHGDRAGETPASTMEELAREYLRAVPEDQPPAVLGGISMGAVAALHAALLRPEVVAGLVLFSGSAESEPAHRRRLYRSMARTYEVTGPALPLRWAVARAAFGPGFHDDPDVARRHVGWGREVPRKSVAASLRLMADRPSLTDRLGSITAPAAVVAGARDRIFPPSHARDLAAGLPHASLDVLADAGHALVVERPAAAARVTDRLLGRVRALSAGH